MNLLAGRARTYHLYPLTAVEAGADGAALETLVFPELRAYIAYRSLDLKLFTWRTGAGVEADFVAYGGDGLFAIEVKRSRRIRRGDLQGLTQFKADTRWRAACCSSEATARSIGTASSCCRWPRRWTIRRRRSGEPLIYKTRLA